ncbi:hypothetical protein XELAEV_18004092mg [Xenopus laevis]|uniref:G-protein coupled receptors family 3 profile domain-containing protein n=1 Tax=Xenopus laevis TaxID=8355 RepID=A0A974H053_XENLA|nr:hypothetical protein XELAEV_18004092mg [Xenopus laevis]
MSPVDYTIFSLYTVENSGITEIEIGKYSWKESGSSLEINTKEIIWKKDTNNQVGRKNLYNIIGLTKYCIASHVFQSLHMYICSNMEICLKCEDYEWPNQEKTVCIKKQIEFLSYDGDSITLVFIIISILLFIIAAVILGIFISFRDTPVVKANNRNLSFILIVSIKLSFLSVFLFLGRPTDITCMLRQISFGITFSIAMSSILAKSFMVCLAFKATNPRSRWRKWVGVKVAYCIVSVCSIIQIQISVIWLATCPPFVEFNIMAEPGKIIIQCNEGSVITFYIVLSYMGLLASVSFIVAFFVRTLPDSFNEAKYITFSMLLFCSVWITMIPAYLSTKGKTTVCVEIFAILTSSAGLLGCIFLPKCYIIVFKPEMNTKQHLLGKIK